MCRIDRPAMGASVPRIGSFTNAPWPEQKWLGSRLRFLMSSYRVTAQKPGAHS